jgi:DNA-directed RNA polymerases I, II, and III subunit RPABC3
MSDSNLFESDFVVTSADPQKYDRVSRLTGEGQDNVKFILDINTDLYPVQVGETVTLCLASTLNLDGSKDEGKGWREQPSDKGSLAELYDYVCYGKVYRFKEEKDDASTL